MSASGRTSASGVYSQNIVDSTAETIQADRAGKHEMASAAVDAPLENMKAATFKHGPYRCEHAHDELYTAIHAQTAHILELDNRAKIKGIDYPEPPDPADLV